MGLKFYCYIDDDGRLYITDGMGGARVRLEPKAIDPFIDSLQGYICRMRDGKESFSIDSETGEVELESGGDVRPLVGKGR